MKRFALIVSALVLAISAPAFAESAVVRGLDKVTGHARDYVLPIGRTTRIGTLDVTARACQKSAPEDTPEVTIFVDVLDHPPAAENAEAASVEVFHGWLFASSPGLSAIEHPYFDLWAVDCRA
jgi:hypothetical protein